jgi:hypothetical protein
MFEVKISEEGFSNFNKFRTELTKSLSVVEQVCGSYNKALMMFIFIT